MKKLNVKIIFILSITVMLLTPPAHAQSGDRSNGQFGIKGGLNLSNMYTDDVDDKNMKIGFNAGLFAKIPVTDNLAFQPELLYTTKGAELVYNNILINGTATFGLNYIEVPLLAVVNITENINLHGGAYVASLMSVNIKNESNVNIFDFENELQKDDFETFDYGLVLGAGVDLNKVSLGVRYEYGLKTVGKDKPLIGPFPDARNSNLQVYLAISIL